MRPFIILFCLTTMDLTRYTAPTSFLPSPWHRYLEPYYCESIIFVHTTILYHLLHHASCSRKINVQNQNSRIIYNRLYYVRV